MRRTYIMALFVLIAVGCGDSDESSGEDTGNDTSDEIDKSTETATETETIPSHPLENITISQSTAVTSVAIVEWLGDLSVVDPASITDAYVEYGLGDTFTMRAPVDMTAPAMRTLVLGMKAGALTYSIRSVVTAGGATYTSPVHEFETGYAPIAVPTSDVSYRHPSLPVDDGYVLTGTFSGNAYALVADAEGDVVWWTKGLDDPGGGGATGTSDFTMDWAGKHFYLIATNPENHDSPIRRVSLDGMEVVDFPAGRSHHSLKPVPEGGVVYIANILDAKGEDACDAVVHLDENGALTELFNLAEVAPVHNHCHCNFVGYDSELDRFFLSSRNYDLAVYVSRAKELIWSIGRDEYASIVSDDFYMGVVGDIIALHGLDVYNSGNNLLLFNNTETSTSRIWGYEFDQTSGTAETIWSYEREGAGSTELGGVQRLPGGNVQITYSIEGVINQVSPNGEVVLRMDFSTPIGYGNWRKSLYGPPTE